MSFQSYRDIYDYYIVCWVVVQGRSIPCWYSPMREDLGKTYFTPMIKPNHLLDYRQERERLVLEARQKTAEHKSDRGNFYAYLNLFAMYITWETVIDLKTGNFFVC